MSEREQSNSKGGIGNEDYDNSTEHEENIFGNNGDRGSRSSE